MLSELQQRLDQGAYDRVEQLALQVAELRGRMTGLEGELGRLRVAQGAIPYVHSSVPWNAGARAAAEEDEEPPVVGAIRATELRDRMEQLENGIDIADAERMYRESMGV